MVSDVAGLYDLSFDQLLTLDKFGEKSATKLLSAIDDSRGNSCERLLYGLGIRHVGIKAARLIAQRFKNIDKVMQASAQDIAEIATMGMTIADSVVTYFSMPESKQLIQQLKQVGVNMDYLGVTDEQLAESDSFFNGKRFVLTGKLQNITRPDATQWLEDHGAKVSSSVSKIQTWLLWEKIPAASTIRQKVSASRPGTKNVSTRKWPMKSNNGGTNREKNYPGNFNHSVRIHAGSVWER